MNDQRGAYRNLLHSAPPSPIYKLHPTVYIIRKSHPNCKRHCNRWNFLCHCWSFYQTFQSIYNLIASVGGNCKKHPCKRTKQDQFLNTNIQHSIFVPKNIILPYFPTFIKPLLALQKLMPFWGGSLLLGSICVNSVLIQRNAYPRELRFLSEVEQVCRLLIFLCFWKIKSNIDKDILKSPAISLDSSYWITQWNE